MRSVIVVLAMLGAFIGAVDAQTPRRGGTLNFGVIFEPPNYDCHGGATFGVLHAVAPHYSTLLRFDLANYPNVVGDLAERWTVSDDQRIFTFTLRDNVRFHDGTTLSSADVKATYERLRNPPQGVTSVRRASFADIEAIDAPDARTVVFRLRSVNASMLATFASPWNCVYSAARLAQDPTFPARNIMGTGPFRFGEHARGSHWVGARFDGYFREGQPYLDGFRAVFMSPSAVVAALQGGAIQAEFRGLTPAERDRITQAVGERMRIETAEELVHLLVAFNTAKAPFNDVRVRRALSIALDRWGGSAGLGRVSRMRPVGGVMRPGSPYAAPEGELVRLPGFGRDAEAARAEARRLLQEAGVANLSFVLTNRNAPPYTETGVFLVDQWRRIGVNVEHRQVETGVWAASGGSGNFDAIVDFQSDFVDDPALALLKYVSHERSPLNWSRANDATLDMLYDQQLRTPDLAQRNAILRRFETRVLTEAYAVPVLWTQRIIALNAAVRGWRISPSNSLGQDLAEVWLAQ
jgi:peptide/nickel transport system substrate-binding protein